ncbi:DUF6191 domain-containing protein [Streptomyces sp. ML-6]|uniref:DUF6191 domain-containing protein n=1 Tax=Streptomyces sp. ML-6 TaxID=2982693 RepID=UPI0024BFEBF0|nr:DUF6191 domain-containing protein [Streptomyces sp. ML-6]MDK0522431.1 DUF6191 domain-containing protein [Streptomyces sp. ML-6]
MFNFFEEIFAPGRKHTVEEQKRLELSRVDLGIGDPGRGPVDLASGKVTIRSSGTSGAREEGSSGARTAPDDPGSAPGAGPDPSPDPGSDPAAGPGAVPGPGPG